MIHQIFMLVISSQHLKTEDKKQQVMKNSQKYLTAFQRWLNLLFGDTWPSFALLADEAHTERVSLNAYEAASPQP